MSNPDPEVPADTSPPPYLRRVSFLDVVGDLDPNDVGSLIHVAQRVLFDGEEISPYVIDLHEGWAVYSTNHETMLSFCVRADQITPAVLNEAGDRHAVAPRICGRPVLAPRVPWEEYDRETRPEPGIVRAAARMVRVYVFVPEVEIRNAEPGEVSTLTGRRSHEAPA